MSSTAGGHLSPESPLGATNSGIHPIPGPAAWGPSVAHASDMDYMSARKTTARKTEVRWAEGLSVLVVAEGQVEEASDEDSLEIAKERTPLTPVCQ